MPSSRRPFPRLALLMATASVVAGTAAAAEAQAPAAGAPGSVFMTRSPLFLQAPPFDRITDADFQPAIEAGMREQRAEMDRIANDPAPPTFDNTVVAMERSGALLGRVQRVFGAVAQADTDPALQAVQKALSPRLSAHADAIHLDPKLFARVQSIYDRRDSLHLSPEQLQLVKVDYDAFVHAGAKLPPASQARLREINGRMSVLSTSFAQTLLAATKAGALTVPDKAQLAGLGDKELSAAAQDARARGVTGFTLPLQNTTQQPALQGLTDRATRKALFDRSWTRAEGGGALDTRAIVAELAQLRAEKAKLFGYPNYAGYVLENQMAQTPEAVDRFLHQLVGPTRAKAAGEARDIQAMIDKAGGGFPLQPWDWDLYAEQVRKARYDLDEAQIKPYFLLDTVLTQGVFYAADQLYGISFKPRPDLPVYQPDVKVFEVTDKDGSTLGLMYFDYFKRDNKAGRRLDVGVRGPVQARGHAAGGLQRGQFHQAGPGPARAADVRGRHHHVPRVRPRPARPVRGPDLSHPVGHQRGARLRGVPLAVQRALGARPQGVRALREELSDGRAHAAALVDKIKAAAKFNQGYRLGELLAAAELDQQWHALPATAPRQDVDAFETAALKRSGADFPSVPPRYRSSYFSHVWAGGYASGYYAYLWTEMLDDDAFSWFTAHGGLTRANGQRFRDMILSRGHTLDYGPMFRAFYGKDPDIGPMLVQRGLVPAAGS